MCQTSDRLTDGQAERQRGNEDAKKGISNEQAATTVVTNQRCSDLLQSFRPHTSGHYPGQQMSLDTEVLMEDKDVFMCMSK